MFNVLNILRNNRLTFYNYSTGKPISQNNLNILKTIFAVILACLFFDLKKDFVEAVLSIYAILVGFSFNVLFYLLSIERKKADAKSSIEKKAKTNRLNRLAQELFYNISYFNFSSIVLILVCLLFYLCRCENSTLLDGLAQRAGLNNLSNLKRIIHYEYNLLFFLILIESVYTFFRTLGRVSFYFNEKIAYQEI